MPNEIEPSEDITHICDSINKKKWTILVYAGGDNGWLPSVAANKLDKFEPLYFDNNVNLIAQFDPEEKTGKGIGVCRFYLNHEKNTSNINIPVLENLGQINMTAPETLIDFITWGFKNYPAENHMLIMNTGGTAWSSVAIDVSHNYNMSFPCLSNAMETAKVITGKKIDILAFDTYMAANVEVGYELRNVADFMVASQGLGNGLAYNIILPQVINNSYSPKDAAIEITQAIGHAATLSTLDLSKMETIAETINKFADALIKTDTDMSILRGLIDSAFAFDYYSPYRSIKDQIGFAEMIIDSPDIKDEKLKEAAIEVVNEVASAILANDTDQYSCAATGLNIDVDPDYNAKEGYEKLQFAKDTNWVQAMRLIHSKQ